LEHGSHNPRKGRMSCRYIGRGAIGPKDSPAAGTDRLDCRKIASRRTLKSREKTPTYGVGGKRNKKRVAQLRTALVKLQRAN